MGSSALRRRPNLRQVCFILISFVIITTVLKYHKTLDLPRPPLRLQDLNQDNKKTTPRDQEKTYSHLSLFDLSLNSSDSSKCYPLKVNPPAVICVNEKVSKSHGTFEGPIIEVFKDALTHDSTLDFLDFGAHLGLYSLTAAAMGRRVIAVEPLNETISRFHKSVKMNRFEERTTLITNALSNKREKVYFRLNSFNQGGTQMLGKNEQCSDNNCSFARSILVDDIVPLIIERKIIKAIMKIDIEGAEHLALANASDLFTAVHIPLIFMEVKFQKTFCGSKVVKSMDDKLSRKMFSFLGVNGFTRVYKARAKKEPLNPKSCTKKWPNDVIWVHKSQRFPP